MTLRDCRGLRCRSRNDGEIDSRFRGNDNGSGGGVCLGEDFYWVEDCGVTYVLDLYFCRRCTR